VSKRRSHVVDTDAVARSRTHWASSRNGPLVGHGPADTSTRGGVAALVARRGAQGLNAALCTKIRERRFGPWLVSARSAESVHVGAVASILRRSPSHSCRIVVLPLPTEAGPSKPLRGAQLSSPMFHLPKIGRGVTRVRSSP